ncbi:MAG: hypothetical protein E6I14_03095 [Chloroflexi bacterium]|nr:MAG: hypothetical protein E6I14_03095 [Chloroflexota bacterium]
MSFFGGPKKYRQKYRVVPRPPGDTSPPPDPVIAEAMRNNGMDPSKFKLEPFEGGEAAPPMAAMFPSGARLEHTFAFDTVNGALSAIERIVDDDVAARISRQTAKWVVVFDEPADPSVPAKTAHEQVATRVSDLGGEDRGFSHLTMNATK